jgi:hypothetical protein
LPLPFPRRLIEGVQVPLTLVATMGLVRFLEERRASGRRILGATVGGAPLVALVVLLLSVPTQGVLLARGLMRVRSGDLYWYTTADEQAAMRWLDWHAEPGSVVLSSWTLSNQLPRFTRCHVFVGHFCQTLDFQKKKALMDDFYRYPIPDADRAALFATYGITWLIVGPREREIGPFDPSGSPLWEKAYESGSVSVWRLGRRGAAGRQDADQGRKSPQSMRRATSASRTG